MSKFKETIRKILVKLAQKLRELVCLHDWECVSDVMISTAENVRFKCKHCDKEEGL